MIKTASNLSTALMLKGNINRSICNNMNNAESDFCIRLVNMHDILYKYAIRLTEDYDDANDLVQDTTIKALSNMNKFVEGTNLKSWLMAIMHNLYINNVRQMAYKARSMTDFMDYACNKYLDSGINNSEVHCTIKDIYKTMNELPNEFCEAFNMFVKGYKYKEIAIKLNIPIGTVKSRIFSSRAILKEKLIEYR